MSFGSSFRRTAAVATKDVLHTSRGAILIFAVLVPLVATLVISAVVDSPVLGDPRLGLVDLGASELPERLAEQGYINLILYEDVESLRQAVEWGDLEMGVVLPEGLDQALVEGEEPELEVFIWGESRENQRALLSTTLDREVQALADREVPIEAVLTRPIEREVVPWEDRLFPLVVIMVIIYGGILIPATVLVKEKQGEKLRALTATPLSLTEVLVAKGLTGMLVSIVMGVVILAINQAFGPQPWLVVGIIALSSLLAAELGLIMGLFIGNTITLFAVIEGLSILLYAPALFYLFPDLPDWIARLFPTYYMLAPIVDMSLHDAVWADIASDVYVLIGLTVITSLVGVLIARRVADKI